MQKYWAIAPVESKDANLFNNVWTFCLRDSCITIGWQELGDCSKMSRDEILSASQRTFVKKPPQTQSLYANMVWAFFNEIREGDIVVARRGRKQLAGIGVVTGPATFANEHFNLNKPPELLHQYFLPVNWNPEPRDVKFPTIVFSMLTVSELKKDAYDNLIAGKSIVLPEPFDPPIEDPTEIVLEKYLEEFIVSNFAAIFKNSLQIFVDADGNLGQQYDTLVGRIDILAYDPKLKEYVIIELKKGLGSDKVVGQTLRYMGWVKANLCTNGEGVRGLIICGEPDEKLTFALTMTPNISVRYYTVNFKLSDSP